MEKKNYKKEKDFELKEDVHNITPQALDLEVAVLGACLLEKDAIGEVIDILTPQCFYKEENSIVWSAIMDLYINSNAIDILTVVNKVREFGKIDVCKVPFIASLTSKVSSSAHVIEHARIILEKHLKREIIRISQENIKNAYESDSDVIDVYARGISKLESALSGVIKYDINDIGKIHQNVMANSYEIAMSGGKIKNGVPTGFIKIDNYTNGWQKSDLIILAGRPGMGKTICGLAFALNPALNENIPTAFFSLEMSKEQIVSRAQSILSDIDSNKISKKQLTVDECRTIDQKCSILNTMPLYIDDTPSLSLIEFKTKSRKLVKEKGVKLIVIDYLQLMTHNVNKGNREQEVAEISRTLKALAKELDIPIIALSQLSRAVELRADKKPMLSDLRESGSIEQDANLVIFCYRPEYYNIVNYEVGGNNLDTHGLMCLIVAKDRSGAIGEYVLGLRIELTKLENYDDYLQSSNYYEQPTYNQPKSIKPSSSFESQNSEIDSPF